MPFAGDPWRELIGGGWTVLFTMYRGIPFGVNGNHCSLVGVDTLS